MLLFFVFSLVLELYLLFLQYFATLSVTSPSSHEKLESPLCLVNISYGHSAITASFGNIRTVSPCRRCSFSRNLQTFGFHLFLADAVDSETLHRTLLITFPKPQS